MKKTGMIFVSLLLLANLFSLYGCSCGSPKATTQPLNSSQASNQPLSTSSSLGTVLVQSPDGNISISVPTGWNTSDTALYPGSVIGVADSATNEFLIILERAKSNFASTATASDYLNTVKSAFNLVLLDAKWGQPSNVTIGGCKGLAIQATGVRKSNNTSTIYYVNVLESKNYFYNVCGYTLAESAGSNKATLQKIINSFKEKD